MPCVYSTATCQSPRDSLDSLNSLDAAESSSSSSSSSHSSHSSEVLVLCQELPPSIKSISSTRKQGLAVDHSSHRQRRRLDSLDSSSDSTIMNSDSNIMNSSTSASSGWISEIPTRKTLGDGIPRPPVLARPRSSSSSHVVYVNSSQYNDMESHSSMMHSVMMGRREGGRVRSATAGLLRRFAGNYEESVFSGRLATPPSLPIHFVCQLTISGRVRTSSVFSNAGGGPVAALSLASTPVQSVGPALTLGSTACSSFTAPTAASTITHTAPTSTVSTAASTITHTASSAASSAASTIKHTASSSAASSAASMTTHSTSTASRLYTRHFVIPFSANIYAWPDDSTLSSASSASTASTTSLSGSSSSSSFTFNSLSTSTSLPTSPISGPSRHPFTSHHMKPRGRSASDSFASGALSTLVESMLRTSIGPVSQQQAQGTPFLGTISLAHARPPSATPSESSPVVISHFFSSSASASASSSQPMEDAKMIRVPMKGQLQLVIRHAGSPSEILMGESGPNGTGVAKVFLIPYDYTGMVAGSRTFLRQKVYWTPQADASLSSSDQDHSKKSHFTSRGPLRHGVHLSFVCSHSPQAPTPSPSVPLTPTGTDDSLRLPDPAADSTTTTHRNAKRYLYLHKSIRVVFGHRAAWPQEEQLTVYEGPFGEWMPGDTTQRRF